MVCTGVCTTDGGPDSGAPPGGSDGGFAGLSTTIRALRQSRAFGLHVQLPMVQVEQIWENAEACGFGFKRTRFWVRDLSLPSDGLWIDTGCGILRREVFVGQQLDIDGWFGVEPMAEDVDGVRERLSGSTDGGLLAWSWFDAGRPFADPVIDGGDLWAALDAGLILPSMRVWIRGPVALVDPAPALFQVHSTDGGIASRGFTVTGGARVFAGQLMDGDAGCDWSDVVLDGGHVHFPLGVGGTVDTFWRAACLLDGGCPSVGDDGGLPFVIYPRDCLNDAQGMVDGG